ncbi:hypothetical protein PINS_up011481 [Pythium insidiosum]|nr:hypothetical protein PINS_up011481 [Pythium insidiosum]
MVRLESMVLGLAAATGAASVSASSSMSSLPAFEIPSFDYASLLQGETPQRVLQALQTDGMVSLKNIPNYAGLRELYLRKAAECAGVQANVARDPFVQRKLFEDGTQRFTISSNAGRELKEQASTAALDEVDAKCPGYRALYEEFSEALEHAVNTFGAALDETAFTATDGHKAISSRKLVSEAVRLDHFHAYEASAAELGSAESASASEAAHRRLELSLPLHEDHGLFIAMTAPKFFEVTERGELVERRLASAAGTGLMMERPSTGERVRPVMKEDEVVLMMGTGSSRWLKTSHDIPAVMHGMKMPEEMVGVAGRGRRALRAWFGKMTLLPAYQRMLRDSTVLFGTHTNVTTRYLLQNNEADLKSVGCAPGRRLAASDGMCTVRSCRTKSGETPPDEPCNTICNRSPPRSTDRADCAASCTCSSSSGEICWMLCVPYASGCSPTYQTCSGQNLVCPPTTTAPPPTTAPPTPPPTTSPPPPVTTAPPPATPPPTTSPPPKPTTAAPEPTTPTPTLPPPTLAPETRSPSPSPSPTPTSPEEKRVSPTPAPTAKEATTGSSASKFSVITTVFIAVGSALLLVLIAIIARRCRRSEDDDVEAPEFAPSPQPYYAAYTNKDSPSEEMTEGVSTKASSARLTASTSRLSTVERELSIAFSDADVLALRLPMQRLTIGAEISHGAFGRVYTGVYDRQQVAIKRLSPELRNHRRHILGFLSEAKLMSTMLHERIIRFIGIAWTSPTDLMVVTEFMPGGDLRSLLKGYADRSLPTGFSQDKLKIALHVIEGLAYMHSLEPQVLHRDLKSRNILLSASLDACLTDFGVSRERTDVTMTTGVGTLRWMAPEVMQGGRYTDTADVFSFGVVLSELDTHQLPYVVEGRNLPDAAIITQISLGMLKVSFSPLADKDIVELARQCMAMSPADRPSAAYVLSRFRQIFSHHVMVLSNRTFDV